MKLYILNKLKNQENNRLNYVTYYMRNIAAKLVGIGLRMRKGLSEKLGRLDKEVQETFTKIRLFTRGKEEKAVAQKKKLSGELHRKVSGMRRLIQEEVNGLKGKTKDQYQ